MSNFLSKTIISLFMFYSRFMLFPKKIEKKLVFGGNIEKYPFTYWLNGRWFLQMLDWEF